MSVPGAWPCHLNKGFWSWNPSAARQADSYMSIQPDFEELLRLLEESAVEYLIVGGYAVALHGFPRYTKDIDLFFNSSQENVDRVISTLIGFGFSSDQLNRELFSTPGNIITFGITPVRVDFLNEIDGVSFKDAWPNRVRRAYGSVTANFIGFDDLIKNKSSTGRNRDKLDVEELS